MQQVTENGHGPDDHDEGHGQDVVYAGFWRRWAALFLDQLILGAAFYGLIIVLAIIVGIAGGFGWMASLDPDAPPLAVIIGYFALIALYYVAAGLYFALMESSRHQATLGKMALGIKVVDGQGRRLSFGHALGRWFAAALSYLTLYIGFLMTAFTDRKRALHDMVAGTLVVDRWAYTDRPELQKRALGGCLIVFIVGIMLMILLLIVAVLAAIAMPAYQDYVQRAKVSQAVIEASPTRLLIEDFRASEGRCPFNEEGGIGPAESLGGAYATRVKVGEYDDGSCGIELELGGTGHVGLDGEQIWWQLDSDGQWICSSSVDDRWLPRECRD